MNAGVAAARGPFGWLLQTTAGQYVVLGLGAASIFPEKCEELIKPMVRSLVLGFPTMPLASDLLSGSTPKAEVAPAPSSPIVIQTGGKTESTQEKVVGQLIAYTITAGGVWVSYTILVNYLPDWAKEMLPVTRQVFDKAVQNLGRGIIEVSEQIHHLFQKQGETHNELVEARNDILNVQNSIDRCEDALDTADGKLDKTQKGIKLLVRAVATMVPGSHSITNELNEFAREIHIDPEERGEYLAIQEINKHNPSFMFGSPAPSRSTSMDDGTTFTGKYIKNSRTPTTRSVSDESVISEISQEGEQGKKAIMDSSMSYMSGMFSPPSVGKPSLKNRLDSLLNNGTLQS